MVVVDFFSRRSALDGLLPFQPHPQGLKAQAAVKANSDKRYEVDWLGLVPPVLASRSRQYRHRV